MGHLFQGKYGAVLIDIDAYPIQLVRYIHCNPVRAGVVTSRDEYRWSSHLTYLGREVITWLFPDWILSQFFEDRGRAS